LTARSSSKVLVQLMVYLIMFLERMIQNIPHTRKADNANRETVRRN
jgi:hypothetical protein